MDGARTADGWRIDGGWRMDDGQQADSERAPDVELCISKMGPEPSNLGPDPSPTFDHRLYLKSVQFLASGAGQVSRSSFLNDECRKS